jgi:hypothetical protein
MLIETGNCRLELIPCAPLTEVTGVYIVDAVSGVRIQVQPDDVKPLADALDAAVAAGAEDDVLSAINAHLPAALVGTDLPVLRDMLARAFLPIPVAGIP